MKIVWNDLQSALEFLKSRSIETGKRYWVVDKELRKLYYVGRDKSFGVRILTQDLQERFPSVEAALIQRKGARKLSSGSDRYDLWVG